MDLTKVLQNPATLLYLFADEKNFISKLDSRTASIIRSKKRNQQQVLVVAAGGNQNYNDALKQIRQAFSDTYAMSPEKALVTLANGGEVAGKNWAKGIYGIGTNSRIIKTTFVQNAKITVDPETGYILKDGAVVGNSPGDYVRSGRKTVPNTYSYVDEDGNTYTAQYNRANKKYYACTYTNKDGAKQNAEGIAVTNADSSSIWANLIEALSPFLDWFMSIFSDMKDREVITSKNTLPRQTDGFVQQGNSLDASGILLAVVAGGALMYGMQDGKTKKKKK